jgi:hypothetical protein
MSDTSLVIDVLESFKALQKSLYQFSAALYHDANLPCWMPAPILQKNVRQQSFKIISQLEYKNDQDSRSTQQQIGLLGASTESIELIKHINHTKDQFKQAMLALRKDTQACKSPLLLLEFEQMLSKRPEVTQQTLQRIGLARINLKQCYRHIPLLIIKPIKVSWTWAHTKAIKRITVAQAQQALEKKNHAPSIQQQLLKLQKLDANESLAIVQSIAPHLRANITTATEQGVKRHMIPGALPIFYPELSGEKLPQVSEAGQKRAKDQHRLSRSDQKLNNDVFLPALRAYRYL